jgi:dipeptidyl aminopeptidase/acylaminoacyl peptidase
MTRATGARPGAGDPGRLGSLGPIWRWLAPGLSIVGLVLVAIVTLNLLNGDVPFVGGSKGNGNANGNGNLNGGPVETAAPSNVVVVPDVVTFPGSIVYAKAGNIWVQTGKIARQVTTGGNDSMPSWAPDGTAIYFIRTEDAVGSWPASGVVRDYQLSVPSVMRVAADGSGKPVRILSGKVNKNGWTWHAWIRQPVIAPNGRTLAIVSDRPDPSRSDVVLQFYDVSTKKTVIPNIGETPPLGHQDPVWRSDGKVLLYVHNGRDGPKGTPTIYRWDVAKSKATALTGPGYLQPAFSPDGRYVAATKTSSFGNDLVILDASNGRELLRVTNDGASWAPVWSPAGDSIAFLHIQGQVVDLKLVRLAGDAPNWTVKDVTDLTEVSGLDGDSRPGWYAPADQLPAPSVGPTAVPSASGSTVP